MSTMQRMDLTCAVCGKTDRYTVLTSTNTFGSPDLDPRPPEMQRSTMYLWVQECRGCGYVASSVDRKTSVTREFLKEEKYISCEGEMFNSRLAANFYRQSLIAIEEKDIRGAFFSMLHAAWACDDSCEGKNAAICRVKATGLLNELISSESEGKDFQNLVVLRADLLRRAGRFEEVIKQYADFHSEDEVLNDVIGFQIERSKERDTACYRVADAIGEK